jgi:hypothetical protein
MTSNQAASTEAADTILRLMFGRHIADVVRTAAELGLADYVNDKPLNVRTLADATGTHAPSLARLLRALASIGIVNETDDRHYTLTPLGAVLRTDTPGSMRTAVRFLSNEMNERPWQALPHAVRTGELAFPHVFGTDQFTYLSSHPESSSLFDKAMRELTRA